MQKKTKLKVFALGGLQEIGKNMTAFEYGNEIIAVDCGIAFPQDDMLGIDLVIPDFTYLADNRDKFKALFLTHGHEDHIGAIPFLLRQFNVPVYGTRLTLGLLENKLREHNLLSKAKLHTVEAGNRTKCGSFNIEYVRVTHSIADCVALAIRTPVGMVVHSGDFKVDHTPVQGDTIDLPRFAELGREGVKLFLCESTKIDEEGYTLSERHLGPIFSKIFEDSKEQRIMVATFSSNINRIQQIIDCAEKHKRKVAIIGRSMENAVKTASDLGYLSIPKNVAIEPHEIKNYTDKQIVIITTGSQGEPMSALSRMATAEHRFIEIKPKDKIIISSSPIPGNERSINKVVNELMKRGADVISDGQIEVHVSGHAKREEIKLLHALLKPRYLMPIHGEFRHLVSHKNLAIEMGMKKENVFVLGIGDVLELNEKGIQRGEQVISGQTLVDGLGVGDVGNIVLRDRKHLSQDGLMIVVIIMERRRGHVIAGPDIISRGFVYVRESENLMEEARSRVRYALIECEDNRITDWSVIKSIVRDVLKEYLWQKTKRSPMILPVIMEI